MNNSLDYINDLNNDMNELMEVSRTLREDEIKCMNNAVKTREQFWRRMYVRSFFADVEGTTYRLKQQSLTAAKIFSVELQPKEISIINEEAYELTNNAQIRRKPVFSSIDRTVRFAFNIFMKAHREKLDLKLDSDNGWSLFKKSSKLRNRITHPKNSNGLIISDEEFNNLLNAVKWFSNNMNLMMSILMEKGIFKIKKNLN